MEGGPSGDGGAAASVNAGLNSSVPPPFLSKTYDMVEDPSTDAIVSWGLQNNSFVVWDHSEFARDLLTKYFKHNNFSSFVRQLNTYGFRKVDPDRWEFANEGFLRGQKHLLKSINRRKPSHAHSQAQQPQTQNASTTACVEVGNFGVEEEIERLKRDKNVLMQELVRLRQQQETADHQLNTLGERLQEMEQRHQQMMSFLARAMNNPGFLAQLAQQNDRNHHIAGVNKKRRLPRQESRSLEDKSAALDGQIIKYQHLMKKSTLAMLTQILNFDSSPRLESISNPESLLIDNLSSRTEALDSISSSSQNSVVTHAEVPPSLGILPYMPVRSGFSTVGSSSALSDEIQSKAGVADITVTAQMPDISMLSAVSEAIPCEFPEMQGIVPDGNVADIPIENFVLPETESMFVDPIDSGVDGTLPIEGEDQGIPGIFDSLWEELVASPLTGESEGVDLVIQEAIEMQQPASEIVWNEALNMGNLTAQMGLLTSESKG